jgi:deazaflavin-dependent oxidoreductase (nitroreductase family)
MMRAVCGAALVAMLGAVAGAATSLDDLALREASTLELTTTGRKSGKPRTVTIWFVAGDQLYVQSGGDGTTDWYQNLRANPAVTVKIGEREWQGRARAIDDPAATARVHELFKQKYLSARVMSWFGGGFGTGKVVAIDLE